MARDVNKYESVLLDHMVTYGRMLRKARGNDEREDIIIDLILLLLDCIVDFREPIGGTPVEDGCGAMVGKVDEWAKMMDAFFAESARVLKKGGSMIVFMAVIKVETVIDIAQRHGLYYKTTGTWHKTNPMPRNMNLHYINSCESWVYFVNGAKTGTFNNDGKPMHDFMECSVAPKSERTYGKHPTQKPEALMMGFVETLTNQGDVVLDPFMGSGTSGVVSVRAGRQFIGFELSKDYFAMANERVLAAESKQPTLWAVMDE